MARPPIPWLELVLAGVLGACTSAPTAGTAGPIEPAPERAPSGEPPAPSPTPAGVASTLTEPAVDLPAPGPGWRRVAPEPAFGYISAFFGGSGEIRDAGFLRPLGAWKRGERATLAVYRRVEPRSGAAIVIEASQACFVTPRKLSSGALWFDLPSDGTQFYFVTSGSLVVEAQDELGRKSALAAGLEAWAARVFAALEKPAKGP